MFSSPHQILGLWARGLFAVALLAGAGTLLALWHDASREVVPVLAPVAAPPARAIREVETPRGIVVRPARLAAEAPARAIAVRRGDFRFRVGWDRATALLLGGVALLAWASIGRWIGLGASKLRRRLTGDSRPPADPGGGLDRLALSIAADGDGSMPGPGAGRRRAEGTEGPRVERGGEVRTIRRPDGSEIRVECYGPPDAPPVVWVHGWAADATVFYYPKKYLSDRFRLILWDEPGMGLSRPPGNADYSMGKFAADLDAVVGVAAGRPVVLVGHSIGGMILLSYAKAFPGALGTRVSGLILAHTTYTNPIRTMGSARLYTFLERPVIIPLLRLTIATWPIAWALSWLSYWNGTTHRSTRKASFSPGAPHSMVDFIAQYMPRLRPDIVARGMLGMIEYDATAALATIPVPTLVIDGDQDATTLPAASRFMADRIPGSTLATLSPAKHMGFIEHHDRFDRLVADFVDARRPASTPPVEASRLP